jgi:hypothetical protein
MTSHHSRAAAAKEGLRAVQATAAVTLGGVLCRLAYIARDGRTVELSTAERNRLLFRDRDVRREVLRASRMYGPRGRLILLREPKREAPPSARRTSRPARQ